MARNCSATCSPFRLRPFPRRFRHRAAFAAQATVDQDCLKAKTLLRELSSRTERGRTATSELRSQIEETQVSLEVLSHSGIDFEKLKGRWELIYTDALDVLPVLYFGQPPLVNGLPWPIRVGRIYQEFSSPEEGTVKNIIKLGFDNFFEEEGITFTVYTTYTVAGPKRIALQFKRAEVGDLKIAPFLESLLAPAVIPRTGLNHQLLLAMREFNLSVPLTTASSMSSSVTAGYLLTYLDDDLLIGRPLDQGGRFIFNKANDTEDSQW